MSFSFKHTVAFQLLLAMLSVLLLVIVSLHYWFYLTSKNTLQEYETETLELISERLSSSLTLLIWNFNYESARAQILSETNSNVLDDIYVYTDVGENLSTQEFELDIEKAAVSFPLEFDEYYLATVYLFKNTSSLIELRRALIKSTLISMAITIFLISVAMFLVTRQYIARPLQTLEKHMHDIAGSDDEALSFQLPVGQKDDEIRRVSVAFNVIIEKIRALLQQLNEKNTQLKITIEEREKIQSMLVESEKMASLGSLVAGVAHEINTPTGIGITALSSAEKEIQLIEQGLKDKSLNLATLSETLAHIDTSNHLALKNLHRVAELVKSFKQVSADQNINDVRRVDLHREIEDLFNSIRPKFKTVGAKWVNDVSDNLVLNINAGDLFQILSNLIMNAFYHGLSDTPDPIITVSAEETEDRSLKISVSDNGKGMSDETREKIFEPFYTTNRAGGGTGLGLHIVYNIVHQKLNGHIECMSTLGEGSSFTIHLPKALEQSAASVSGD